MSLKRLSDVSVGSHIKLGGDLYKLTQKYEPAYNLFTFIAKRVTHSIYQSPVHICEAVPSFRTEKEFLVEEVTGIVGGPAPAQRANPTDLTGALRSQVNAQSLTQSLKGQIQQSAEGEQPNYEPNYAESQYIGRSKDRYQQDRIDAVEKQAVTNSFRSQTALSAAQKAKLLASIAGASAQTVRRDLDGYQQTVAEELDFLDDSVASVAVRANRNEGLVEELQEEQEEHDARISYLERKHYEEEEKLSIQREFNAGLARQKEQAELQEKFNQTTKNTGGNGKMKNLLGGLKSQFGKVEGKFAFAATGGLAIRKGISQEFVAFDKETNSITDVSGLTLDFKIPAFKLPTAVDKVKKGDIVLNGADFGYVTRVHDDFLEVIIPEKNVNGSVRPTRNALMNAAFYTVVQTMDAAGDGGFNPMLLMAMGDGNKDELVKIMAITGGFGGAQGGNGGIDPMMMMMLGDNMDDLLPLLLMQQGGAVEGNGLQSMLPFLLMSDKKDGKSNDMLPLLMMSQGQQGGQAGGMNPMTMMALAGDGDIDPMMMMAMSGGFGAQGGGLFGGQATQAPVQQAPASTDSTDGE